MKKKVLVVVAHPDDETIWMGGVIWKKSVEKKDWDLTIISLCRRDDIDRAPKFKRVCAMYNAKSFISDLEDETLEDLSLDEIIKRIQQFAERSYDEVYTHGENGEYGHKRHTDVNLAIKEMLKRKNLICKKIFFFDCQKKSSPGTDTGFDSLPNPKPDKFINLKSILLLKKQEIIHMVYGFKKESFEFRCCTNAESFKEERGNYEI